MTVTVRLPFYSAGASISVTQEPGVGDHQGVLYNAWDFALETDWRVRSVAKGTVVDIRETVPDGDSFQLTADPSYGSGGIGNIVTVRSTVHHQTFYTSYFHLQQNSVPITVGDHVVAGQILGEVGLTGARTGAHLHIQIGTSTILYGFTANGWASGNDPSHVSPTFDNGNPQIIADASPTSANINLISWAGYGTNLPSTVIGPPPPFGVAIPAAPQFTGGNDTVGLIADGTVHALAGNDTVAALSGTHTVFGDAGNDAVALAGGNDTVYGGRGADNLSGGGGADVLDGGSGADHILAGSGNDTSTGGADSDVFIFDARFGADQITDFGNGGDIVTLFSSIWGGASKNNLQVLASFGHDLGSDYALDFGGGNSILFVGMSDGLALLASMAVLTH